jgi:hypothetical protein
LTFSTSGQLDRHNRPADHRSIGLAWRGVIDERMDLTLL